MALHYSYKFTHWSRFKELHATFNDGEVAFHKDEKYRSNSRYALGATYNVNDKLTVRAGIAYDEAAAPTEHASASIPDTDRMWYSVGQLINLPLIFLLMRALHTYVVKKFTLQKANQLVA